MTALDLFNKLRTFLEKGKRPSMLTVGSLLTEKEAGAAVIVALCATIDEQLGEYKSMTHGWRFIKDGYLTQPDVLDAIADKLSEPPTS